MEDFFSEKILSVEDEDGEIVELKMRPLKVKEFPQIFRISAMQEKEGAAGENGEMKILPFLIDLVAQTIDKDIEKLPSDALNEIISEFIELNFGKEEQGKKEIKNTINDTDELAISFDFLIIQGHSFSDILNYTLPQLRIFQKVACDRLLGKKTPKKMDPLEAFRKLGIPIKYKEKKE